MKNQNNLFRIPHSMQVEECIKGKNNIHKPSEWFEEESDIWVSSQKSEPQMHPSFREC